MQNIKLTLRYREYDRFTDLREEGSRSRWRFLTLAATNWAMLPSLCHACGLAIFYFSLIKLKNYNQPYMGAIGT
jgi:hypothetical protein